MMKIEVVDEGFSICKVKDYFEVDLGAPFMFTGSTDHERSLVCLTSAVPANCTAVNDGWRALRVEGTLDFSLIGILSRMTTALADAAIGVFAISTFDTDYLLVKETDITRALDALEESGFQLKGER